VCAGPFFLALLLTTLLAGLILPALLSVTLLLLTALLTALVLLTTLILLVWIRHGSLRCFHFSLLFLTETNHRAA